MKTYTKLCTTILIIVAIIATLVVSTVAWFNANKVVQVSNTTITAEESMNVSISIPSQNVNPDSYMGQTGVEFSGLDSPYILTYRPVNLTISKNQEENLYVFCDISLVSIRVITSENSGEVLNKAEIDKNFTWRFGRTKLINTINPITGVEESNIVEVMYINNNGFLQDELTGEYLAVNNEENISFTMYLYFVGEEGLRLLESTGRDIDEKYTFDYSDVSYMWSTFNIQVEIGIKQMYEIRFNTMGGESIEPQPTSGASAVLLPQPTWVDDSKYFIGWYENREGLGMPFDNYTLLRYPKKGDFTLFAKWGDNE